MIVKLTSLLIVVFVFKFANGKKEINITIMVPGVRGFEELVSLVESQQNHYFSQYSAYNSANYTTERHNYSDLDYESDFSSGYGSNYYFEFNGETVSSNCISVTHKKLNIICVHDINYFYTYSWSYLYIKPALEAALEEINKTKGLLDEYQIKLHYYDSGDEKGKTSDR